MTSKMNKITYFCIDSECDKEVATYGAPCCLEHNPLVEGNVETLSHETSECPGCGMEIYVGANGYCSYCWVERFGCEDDDFSIPSTPESFVNLNHEAPPCSPIEHKCCGEWDYERGIRVCDFADEPACPQYRSESEIRKNCEALPPLPPSPVADVEEDIAQAMEKLEVGGRAMTPGQCNDWEVILKTRQRRLREMTCTGCRDNVLNQQGHMSHGGCLYEEYTPWDNYDNDYINDIDRDVWRWSGR